MNIITISREFGSGGRELGKRLADELGLIIMTVKSFWQSPNHRIWMKVM